MKQQTYYNPKLKQVRTGGITLLLLGILILGVSIATSLHLNQIRSDQARMQTTVLPDIEAPCQLVVTLTYSSEEPDVRVLSPSGIRYTTDNTEYETARKSITFYINSAESGDWKVEYNNLTNKNIQITYALQAPTVLLLSNLNYNSSPGNLTISGYAAYETDSLGVKVLVTATSQSANKSLTICDDVLITNESFTLTCDTSYLTTADDWIITLITYGNDTDDPLTGTWTNTITYEEE